VISSGTGQFVTLNTSGLTGGAGVAFAPGTLANAPNGTLVVMFDINFSEPGRDSPDSGSLLRNIIAYLSGQSTVATGLGRPFGVAITQDGLSAYIPDPSSHRVWKVDLTPGSTYGTKTVVAGTGEQGYNGDGINAVDAQLDNPSGVAVDDSGALYIADTGNHAIRKILAPGQNGALIRTVAGIPTSYAVGESTAPECANQPTATQCVTATNLRLFGPRALAFAAGNLFIVDRMNQQIKRFDVATNFIFVVAGVAGRTGLVNGTVGAGAEFCEPNTDCTLAPRFNSPVGIVRNVPNGNVLVADEGNNRIRSIFLGDVESGPSVSTFMSGLVRPTGVAVAGNGNVYVVNYGRHVVVSRCGGECTPIVIAGTDGVAANPAAPDAAHLNSPMGVAVVDRVVNDQTRTLLYIADMGTGRLLVVDVTPPEIFLK